MLGASGSSSDFFFFTLSIDQYGGEGGSSDVAVKLLGCVRVQLSKRKKETRNKKGKKGRGELTDCVRETDLCCAHRGQTDRQTWRAPRRKTTRRNYCGTLNER